MVSKLQEERHSSQRDNLFIAYQNPQHFKVVGLLYLIIYIFGLALIVIDKHCTKFIEFLTINAFIQ